MSRSFKNSNNQQNELFNKLLNPNSYNVSGKTLKDVKKNIQVIKNLIKKNPTKNRKIFESQVLFQVIAQKALVNAELRAKMASKRGGAPQYGRKIRRRQDINRRIMERPPAPPSPPSPPPYQLGECEISEGVYDNDCKFDRMVDKAIKKGEMTEAQAKAFKTMHNNYLDRRQQRLGLQDRWEGYPKAHPWRDEKYQIDDYLIDLTMENDPSYQLRRGIVDNKFLGALPSEGNFGPSKVGVKTFNITGHYEPSDGVQPPQGPREASAMAGMASAVAALIAIGAVIPGPIKRAIKDMVSTVGSVFQPPRHKDNRSGKGKRNRTAKGTRRTRTAKGTRRTRTAKGTRRHRRTRR